MPPDLQQLAIHLMDAWNAHDFDGILAHYSEDCELTSPIVKEILGVADGTLRGKPALRQWWRRVLEKRPQIRFELVAMSPGVTSAALTQRISELPGLGVSVFEFDAEGRIRREVYHG